MNRLRQFCAATVLTLMLVFAVFAGEIATGVIPPPPPPQHTAIMGGIATGVTISDESSIETAFVDPVTMFTLNILQSVLALF